MMLILIGWAALFTSVISTPVPKTNNQVATGLAIGIVTTVAVLKSPSLMNSVGNIASAASGMLSKVKKVPITSTEHSTIVMVDNTLNELAPHTVKIPVRNGPTWYQDKGAMLWKKDPHAIPDDSPGLFVSTKKIPIDENGQAFAMKDDFLHTWLARQQRLFPDDAVPPELSLAKMKSSPIEASQENTFIPLANQGSEEIIRASDSTLIGSKILAIHSFSQKPLIDIEKVSKLAVATDYYIQQPKNIMSSFQAQMHTPQVFKLDEELAKAFAERQARMSKSDLSIDPGAVKTSISDRLKQEKTAAVINEKFSNIEETFGLKLVANGAEGSQSDLTHSLNRNQQAKILEVKPRAISEPKPLSLETELSNASRDRQMRLYPAEFESLPKAPTKLDSSLPHHQVTSEPQKPAAKQPFVVEVDIPKEWERRESKRKALELARSSNPQEVKRLLPLSIHQMLLRENSLTLDYLN